jgi:hypothetical protein
MPGPQQGSKYLKCDITKPMDGIAGGNLEIGMFFSSYKAVHTAVVTFQGKEQHTWKLPVHPPHRKEWKYVFFVQNNKF